MQSVVVCALSVVCVLLMSDGVVARVGHFTHYWAVHIEGGRPMADKVAAEHGFVNLDEVLFSIFMLQVRRMDGSSCREYPIK